MPITVFTFEDFKEQQASEPLFVGGRYLFESGAQSDGQYTHFMPPNEAAELVKLQFEFCTAKLKQYQAAYTADREGIAEQARLHKMGVGPMPEAGWKEHLDKLAKEIQGLEQRIHKLRSQMVGERLQQNSFEADVQRHQRADEVLAGLSSMPSYGSSTGDPLDN